jgi:hypothetical protein
MNFNRPTEKVSDDDGMPPQIETDGVRRIVSMLGEKSVCAVVF